MRPGLESHQGRFVMKERDWRALVPACGTPLENYNLGAVASMKSQVVEVKIIDHADNTAQHNCRIKNW